MRTAIVILTLSLVSTAAFADPAKGVPSAYKWLVTPCENWNCAASALVTAAGDPYVIALPTNSTKYSWIVLRRVQGGSYFFPDDAPFRLEDFDEPTLAVSRYSAVDRMCAPLTITTPDRHMLVVYLNTPEARTPTRAVTH
jgi:hypothetical protein